MPAHQRRMTSVLTGPKLLEVQSLLRLQNLVMADRRLTVREIAEEVGVSKDSAHAILRVDLNMNRVTAKFVPKLLSPEQKDLRVEVAQDFLNTANTNPAFL